jgi:large subunit ribosomal protein L12
MEYIYAALLLHNTNKEITEDGIVRVMAAAGVDVDKARVKALVSALDGVNIEDAISQVQPASVYTSMPSAVSVPTAAVPQTQVPQVQVEEEEKEKEEKEKKEKEEKEEEKAEETGMEGLASLFG